MTELKTLRETIHAGLMQGKKARLEKLVALTAPKVIIDTLRGEIERGESGVAKVGHVGEFGDLLVHSGETGKKYRHGTGMRFFTDGGVVLLIPGPHGWFIVKE